MEKAANTFAWLVTIVVIAFLLAYWTEAKWAWKNRSTIKTAAETGDTFNQLSEALK